MINMNDIDLHPDHQYVIRLGPHQLVIGQKELENLMVANRYLRDIQLQNDEELANAHLERVRLENNLQQKDSQIELLTSENTALKETNKRLHYQLKILTPATNDQDNINGTIKRGRFEIKKLQLECSQCRKAFISNEEMAETVCCYHPVTPVLISNGAKQYFWSCCNSSSRYKVTQGCKRGKHITQQDGDKKNKPTVMHVYFRFGG